MARARWLQDVRVGCRYAVRALTAQIGIEGRWLPVIIQPIDICSHLYQRCHYCSRAVERCRVPSVVLHDALRWCANMQTKRKRRR